MPTFGDILPSATTTLAGMKEYANPYFGAFLPVEYIGIGVLVAVSLILFLIYVFRKAIYHLFTGSGEPINVIYDRFTLGSKQNFVQKGYKGNNSSWLGSMNVAMKYNKKSKFDL